MNEKAAVRASREVWTARADAPGVVPRVLRPDGPIVLATEFGTVSSAAERIAIRLAFEADVPLVIVHAIDPGRLRLPGGRFLQRIDQARAARDRDVQAIVRRVAASGVRPQVLVWEGDPATCVLDAARAEGASRIVVGSHGRGRLGRALIGSVSASVAEQADCPVHIVRSDGDHEEISSLAHRTPSSAQEGLRPAGPSGTRQPGPLDPRKGPRASYKDHSPGATVGESQEGPQKQRVGS